VANYHIVKNREGHILNSVVKDSIVWFHDSIRRNGDVIQRLSNRAADLGPQIIGQAGVSQLCPCFFNNIAVASLHLFVSLWQISHPCLLLNISGGAIASLFAFCELGSAICPQAFNLQRGFPLNTLYALYQGRDRHFTLFIATRLHLHAPRKKAITTIMQRAPPKDQFENGPHESADTSSSGPVYLVALSRQDL
jgi:hypothetical protein